MKHFFLRNAAGLPLACVASHLYAVNLTTKKYGLEFAISVWSPHDSFNRSIAIQAAIGRLAVNHGVKLFDVSPPIKHAIIQTIINEPTLYNHEASKVLSMATGVQRMVFIHVPHRIKEAAQLWLEEHPLQATVRLPPVREELPPKKLPQSTHRYKEGDNVDDVGALWDKYHNIGEGA